MLKASFTMFAILWISSMSGSAQDKSTYYTVMHPDEFTIDWTGFYEKADELTAAVREGFPHHLDLAFGEHPKQRLDLYLPKAKPDGAPIFLFLHGGGMREGDRAHYGYVARPFVERGILTAVASYRLTPEFTYPDQPNDVRSAIAWLAENAERYGGDPRQIYVGGHSAGAYLTGHVCANTTWLAERSLAPATIQGCAPISTGYEITEERRREAYLPDLSLRVEASPIRNIDEPAPQFVVAVGAEEESIIAPSREFADELEEHGSSTTVVIEEGMDHAEIVAALGEPDSRLFQAIVEMIESTSSSGT